MAIDLKILGDPDGIDAVADWLLRTMGAAGSEADTKFQHLSTDAYDTWRGEAGRAFSVAASEAHRATTCAVSFTLDLAAVMHAYAGRLRRGQEFVETLKNRARDGGLSVVGDVVISPGTWLTACPGPDAPPEYHAELDRFTRRWDRYQETGASIGQWEGELEAWIDQEFGPLIDRIDELVEAAWVLISLRRVNETVIDTALLTANVRVARDLGQWRERMSQHAERYESHKKDVRSKDPGRSARAKEANPYELRSQRRNSIDKVQKFSKAARIIPGLGVAADVGFGIYDVRSGASVSSVGVEIAAGTVATGAVVVVGAVVTAPVSLVVVLGVATGVVAGQGSRWLWENNVSFATREAIDDGISDYGHGFIFWEDKPRVPQ